jgi:hypothetical protein
MTDDIELPPLPPAEWLGYDPEIGNLHGHSFDTMRAFAAAAVLADRERRMSAEPVAWRDLVLDLIDDCPGLTLAQDAWLTQRVKELPALSAEPVAAALRFPGDARLCLSTVFDTVKEARDFADTRTSGAVVEPLCLCKPAPSAEPVDVAALRAERDALLGIMRRANDAIEALDGTNVENGKLVDNYRAAMAKEPK